MSCPVPFLLAHAQGESVPYMFGMLQWDGLLPALPFRLGRFSAIAGCSLPLSSLKETVRLSSELVEAFPLRIPAVLSDLET